PTRPSPDLARLSLSHPHRCGSSVSHQAPKEQAMSTMTRGKQVAVDLAGYPQLAVIYLGMRVNTLRRLRTLLAFGPRIKASVRAQPDGLLLHEDIIWGMVPPHVGLRPHWRGLVSTQ